jgi:hypothetical protein
MLLPCGRIKWISWEGGSDGWHVAFCLRLHPCSRFKIYDMADKIDFRDVNPRIYYFITMCHLISKRSSGEKRRATV